MFKFVSSFFAATSNDESDARQTTATLKSWGTTGIVASITIGTMYIASRFYRARKHDNIPILAPNDYHWLHGHLPKIIAVGGGLYEWIYKETKKMNWPKVSSLSIPGGYHMIYINDPKLIKFLYEDQFEISIQKPPDVIPMYYELLGNGIFVSNGSKWKFHRKVASRMFSLRNLKDFMYDMSVKHTLSTISKIKSLIKNDNNYNCDIGLDINNLLGRFTLDTFCEIAFGQNVDAVQSYPKEDTFGVAFDDLVYRTDVRTMDIFWKIKRLFAIGNEKYIRKNHNLIIQFINKILDKKYMETANAKQISDVQGTRKHDLLTLYLKHDKNLTRAELKDVALNFVIAGRDTTRMLLSWFIYELCTNKNKNEILEKLMNEMNKFKDGNEPTYNDFTDFNSFKYLECALCETLRLHPPVPFNYKGCIKDVKLPNTNYTIRKGDRVFISHYSFGRDPNLWNDPLVFNPDRWKPKGLNTYNQYQFGVFNIAPRMCLGKKFAMSEAKIFMYYFLKSFQFEKVKNKDVIIRTGAILNMDTGFYVHVTNRAN